MRSQKSPSLYEMLILASVLEAQAMEPSPSIISPNQPSAQVGSPQEMHIGS